MCYNIIFCNMNKLFNEPSYTCKNNKYYYFIYLPCAIIFVFYILITSIIFYKFSFKKDEKLTVSIAKYTIMNSLFLFILIQPISIIISVITINHKNSQNLLIYYLFVTSLILIYYSYYEHKYQNNDDIKELINYFLCCLYCWICLCLIFGKIFNISGMIYPFLIGIFFLFIIFKYWPVSTLEMKSDIFFHSDLELINQLRLLINAVIGQQVRENNLNLLSYFFTFMKNNYDKKELEKLNEMSSEEIRFLFFQYIDNTFKMYNQVFKDSISLKIMYAFFLMNCLGQYSKAYMTFYSLLEDENYYLTYSQEFFIFRQKKYLENKIFDDGSDSTDISTFFQINSFIKLITYISDLFINFWSFLLQSKEDEDTLRLYECGYNICEIREEIDFIFYNLVKSNVKDKKIFLLYGYYLKEILNDHERALEFLKNSDIENYNEMISIGNLLDLSKINSSADFQFMIVSGKNDNFGNIEKISLGLCNLIGYTYDKICGQNINIFLSNFLHKEHDILLKQTVKDYYKNYHFKLIKNSNHEFFYHNTIYIKTSSKYLYPIPLIIGVSIDENFDCVFYAKIDYFSLFDANEFLNNTCHIITDLNLIIQESTSNSILFFENNNFGNKSLDITSIIKEFHSDIITEMSYNPRAKKLEVKKSILRKKYMTRLPIKIVTVGNKKFRMNCSELVLNDKICGYHFNFEMYNENNKIFEISLVPNSDTPRKRKYSHTQLNFLTKELNGVNEYYIPEGKQFYFDIEKKSYLQKKSHDYLPKESSVLDNNNIKNYFYEQYLKEKNLDNLNKTVLNNSDSYLSSNFEDFNSSSNNETSESYNSGSSEIVSENSQIITIQKSYYNKKNSFSEKKNNSNLTNNINEKGEDVYDKFYKIKSNNISFLIYDFDKKVCVNIKSPQYICKVDEIFHNEKQRNSVLSNFNEPKKRKTRILNLQELKQIIKKNKKDYSESLYIHDIINEKIQPKKINKSVFIHLLITVTSFIILLFSLLIYCYKLYNDNKNLSLITEILIEFSNLSIDAYKIIFASTELFFINNEKYTGYDIDKFFYSDFLISELNKSFSNSYEKFQKLRKKNIRLKPKNQKLIDSYSIDLYTINSYNYVYLTKTKLPYLINEYFVNVYQIIYLPFEQRIFTNINYNFLFYNSDTGFSDGTRNYSEIYRDDFKLKKNDLKLMNIIYIISISLIEIIICFFEIYSFKYILEEKEIKMQLFFKMSNEQITICSKKCQNFRMLNQDNLNEPSNLLKIPNINFDTSEVNNINDNESTTLLSENINFFEISKEEKLKRQKTKIQKNKTKIIIKKEEISYIIICMFIIILLILIAIYLDSIFLNVYNYLLIHYSILQYEIFFFKRYSYLRMYILYESYIELDPFLNEKYNILLDFLHSGYSENSDYLNRIHKLIKKYGLPSKTQKKLDKIRYHNICDYFSQLVTMEGQNCETFADGILLKGFEPLSIYFVDAFIYYIKELNKIYEIAKIKNYTYNEYLYGTKEYENYLPKDEETLKDYFNNNPIKVINEKRMFEVIILIHEIYFPLMNDISNSISKDIFNVFNKSNSYIIACIIFFIFLILGFLLINVVPILVKQNNQINTIRKMLEIIPRDIIFNLFVQEDMKNNED